MDAGQLDRRIEFVRLVKSDDGFSSEGATTEVSLGTVYAKKTDVSDGERMRAMQVQANISARFLVRYSTLTASITPMDFVRYGGILYDIYSVKEVGRREGFEITAAGRRT